MTRPFTPAERQEAYWLKVKKTDTCWLWTGAIANTGYGIFWTGKNLTQAHRYQMGLIPQGMQIDHLCRVRACVNPAHLEIVTQRVNILRGESLFAAEAQQTHCVNGHEFTDENTYRRKSWSKGRMCKTCNKLQKQRRRVARPIERESSDERT